MHAQQESYMHIYGNRAQTSKIVLCLLLLQLTYILLDFRVCVYVNQNTPQ